MTLQKAGYVVLPLVSAPPEDWWARPAGVEGFQRL